MGCVNKDIMEGLKMFNYGRLFYIDDGSSNEIIFMNFIFMLSQDVGSHGGLNTFLVGPTLMISY